MYSEYHPRLLSVHNPLIMNIAGAIKTAQRSAWTFEKALLYDENYCRHMGNWLSEFLGINIGSTTDRIVWDTLKAAIRGETLQFSIRRNQKEK